MRSTIRVAVRTAIVTSSLLLGVTAFGVAASSPSALAGGTFLAPVTIAGANVTEPGINVAADGTIYVNGPAGLLSNLPGAPSPVFKSSDGGTSWVRTDPSLRANLPGGGDSNISIDPTTGNLYMSDLWLGSSTVSRSTDGAASWLANPLQVSLSRTASGWPPPATALCTTSPTRSRAG